MSGPPPELDLVGGDAQGSAGASPWNGIVGHTVTRVVDGVAHSQHYGPEHLVDGSIHVIDLPPGVDVFVTRHYAPA